MIKKNVKLVVFVILAAVSLSTITACQKQEKKTNGQGNSTAQTTTNTSKHPEKNGLGFEWLEGTGGLKTPIMNEQTPLKVLIHEHPTFPIKPFNDNLFLQEIAKKTGFKLEMQSIPQTNYKEKLNILLSTNDIPDAIWRTEDDAKINGLGEKGVFMDYSQYLNDMPNLKKILDSDSDLKKAYTASNGKLYIFPMIVGETVTEGMMIRKDIIEKENIKIGETYDDLYKVLKTLKDKYPDMTTWTNRTGGSHLYGVLADSWGTGFGGEKGTGVYLDMKEKKFKFGPLDANFKKMVEYLNKLYAEKILDPEYALLSSKAWEEKLTGEKALFTMDWVTRVGWANDIFIKAKKDVRFIGIIPPKGPTGVRGMVGRSNHVPNEGVVVNAKVKNPKEVAKLMDWFYSPEGRFMTQWGIEGQTFARNNDGTITIMDDVKGSRNTSTTKELNKDFGAQISGFSRYEVKASENVKYKFEIANNNYTDEAKDLMKNNNAVLLPSPILSFNKDQQNVRQSKETVLADFVKGEIDKFIMGGRPLSDWDKFVNDIKSKGVEDVLKVYNDSYAEYLKK